MPGSLPLPVDCGRHLLACGAELKNTFALAKGGRAWVGHHVGDLKNYETLRSFTPGIDHFQRLFAVAPEVVAHDLHPEYLSTKHAHELDGVEPDRGPAPPRPPRGVPRRARGDRPALGAIFDGTGYGGDGTVWGGELLFGELSGFERAGFLFPVRMPGGEAAIRQPWRMACAWLAAARRRAAALPRRCAAGDRDSWRQVAELARTGSASPLTTSAGRLFDAVAALCGVRARGQLRGPGRGGARGRARSGEAGGYPLPLRDDGGAPLVLDARADGARGGGRPATRALPSRRSRPASTTRSRRPPPRPARWRPSAAAPTRSSYPAACSRTGTCSERTPALLRAAGLRVLTPERLPPNDGGIAYGQLAVAAARLARGGRPMFGLDEWIAELAHGEALAVVLAVALLLGLRHASDPDHLAAVSTLIASEPEDGTRARGAARARLGARPRADACAVRPADRAVPRLSARTRSSGGGGAGRADDHVPGGEAARCAGAAGSSTPTPTATGTSSTAICTRTSTARGTTTRTSRRRGSGGRRAQAFGIGLVHGMGGSAGVGVLLLATIPDQAEAVAALGVLALGTAVSMALLSSAFGYAITRGPVLQADACVRARHGGRDPGVRRLVRPRRGRGGPLPAVSAARHPTRACSRERVFAGGRSKPFGEVTADEVRARADELRAATGWGPTAKVAAVAMAWGELARLMDGAQATDGRRSRSRRGGQRAERLWVVPPGGSLLL